MSLSPDQLARFLDVGYLTIPLELPESVHDDVFASAQAAYAAPGEGEGFEARIGRIADGGLLASCPALHQLLEAPALDGALASVLGERYYRHNHAFVHRASRVDQDYHKDSHLPWSMRGAVRSHRPQWVMTFYYPQETTVELGATRVLPGTQYWNVDHEIEGFEQGEDRLGLSDPALQDEAPEAADARLAARPGELDPSIASVPLEVPKGSLLLVNFDLFHRGARRLISGDRFMVKFWYCRMLEPRSAGAIPVNSEDARRLPAIGAVASWLTGQPRVRTNPPDEDSEAGRVASAYAAHDPVRICQDLLSECEAVRRPAMYGATTLGEDALEPALEATSATHWGVRKSGAFVLGELAIDTAAARDALARLTSSDARADVRSTATVALGRIGRAGIATGDLAALERFVDLIAPLTDSSREPDVPKRPLPGNPVRQNAALALLSLATEALEAGVDGGRLAPLAALARAMAGRETDRYARATAEELIRRIGISAG